jgi:hypothetical protein
MMRFVMLRLVNGTPRNTNSSVLSMQLNGAGYPNTKDQAKSEIRWLEQQGLLEVEEVESVLIVSITERGEDVANGLAKVDGIAYMRGA